MNQSSRILVVEDDLEALGQITRILMAEGYDVRPADSGQLALTSAWIMSPQLIVLDIRMPDIDGFEVCRRLQASEKTRGIPIIFVTAVHEMEERVEGLALGAVDFVSKPFRREELLARVRTHLELGRLRADLEKQVAERTSELRVANNRLQEQLVELRLTEQALRESEGRFRNLADTAPVGIWLTDPDNLACFYNKTALDFVGPPKDQLAGNGWINALHPDDREKAYSAYLSATSERRSFRIEFRIRRADGEYRWVLNTGVPRFVDRVYVGHIGTIIDTTDLKRNHEQMLSTQKLESLGALAAGIAHDFNNVLGVIFAESDLALAEVPKDSPVHGNLERIGGVANRASELIDLLIAYAGVSESARDLVDLSTLVKEAIEQIGVAVPKSALLDVKLAKNLSPVKANAEQIRHIVSNLVMNASEALVNEKGLVMVSTEQIRLDTSSPERPPDLPAGDYLRLAVSDTGSGMNKAVQARAFDPFFTTKFLGRGLGLAAVQGIVRSHHGVINVTSRAGFGSTFEVLLPCVPKLCEQAEGERTENGDRTSAHEFLADKVPVI